MGRESAPATNELGLRLAVLRRYVPTLGTLAAGVLWCYQDQQTALPLRFVFQLAAQLAGALQPENGVNFLWKVNSKAMEFA
jgi:hypothetical protein